MNYTTLEKFTLSTWIYDRNICCSPVGIISFLKPKEHTRKGTYWDLHRDNFKLKSIYLIMQRPLFKELSQLTHLPLTLKALGVISVKFLLVISLLYKTQWSWELQTWSHKMNLIDTSTNSPSYVYWKRKGITNENLNFDIRVQRV